MNKRTQHFLQFDVLLIILTCLVIDIQSFKYRTIMEISAFSLYFQEQLHNAYSYVLAYIEFILPQMISFHLSYGLSLCNKNSQRYMFSMYLYVTPHHQMRHKSHTNVLSKWLNRKNRQKFQNRVLLRNSMEIMLFSIFSGIFDIF